MKFIVAEDHSSPLVALSFWARVGVCEEPPEQRGLAHFMEHMMFRGSKNVVSEEHAKIVARMGGDCNAFTSHDGTVYHQAIPAHGLEETFRLESDRFQNLTMTDSHLETEKKVVFEEFRSRENQPMGRAMRHLMQSISGDHPYGLDPLGRRTDLEKMTLADLDAFYKKWYRPDRVYGVLSGDVAVDQAKELAARYFENWASPLSSQDTRSIPPYEIRTGKLSLRISIEIPLTVRLHRLQPGPEEDLATLRLLVSLLTAGEASPMRESLVKKSRLCVEAGGNVINLNHGGLLMLFGVFLPPGRHGPRRDAIRQLCESMAEHGPDPDLLHRHLKRARKKRAYDGYSAENRMQGLGQAELAEGGYGQYENEYRALSNVTPIQIRDYAQKLFAPSNTLELDLNPEKTNWKLYPLALMNKFRRA